MTEWTKSLPSYAPWSVDADSTRRLTEAGSLRVTENGMAVRIIERYVAHWSNQPEPSNPWNLEVIHHGV